MSNGFLSIFGNLPHGTARRFFRKFTTNFTDVSYDNLDLELWGAAGEGPLNLISQSMSRYNNSEHFSFALPFTGEYMLRVRWTEELFDMAGDLNVEQYGLAWAAVAVPEPATLILLAFVVFASPRRSRRLRQNPSAAN